MLPLILSARIACLSLRQLVRKLWLELRVPVYVLVDADPFGVEILCTYK